MPDSQSVAEINNLVGPSALLDRFMPVYDVVERHRTRVTAPATLVFDASRRIDLWESRLVRMIFRLREWLLQSGPTERCQSSGLVEDMKSIGWVVLAEVEGQEIVMVAATRPWEPNVQFSIASAKPIRTIPSARLRKDRLEPARRRRDADYLGLAERDSGIRNRSHGAYPVSELLVCFRPGIVLIRRLALSHLRRGFEHNF